MTFTGPQAYKAAVDAGFSTTEAYTAAMIALAESGGNERAVSKPNTNGTIDYGAWQINSVHSAILASGDKFNLADNAKMAYKVYQGQGFKAWTVYKNGSYKKQLRKLGMDGLHNLDGTPKNNDQINEMLDAQGSPLENVVKSATGIDGLTAGLTKIGGDLTTVIIVVVLLALGFFLIARNTAPVRGALGLAKIASPTGKVGTIAKVLT